MASVPAKKFVSISRREIGTLENIIENSQEPVVNNHDRLLNQNKVAVYRADDSGFSPVRDGGEGPDHYFIVYLKWNSGRLTDVYIGGPVSNSTVQLFASHIVKPIIESHALSPCIRTPC